MRPAKTAIAIAISTFFISTAALADNPGADVSDDIDSLGITMQALHDGDADVSDVLNKIQLPDPAVSHVSDALDRHSSDNDTDHEDHNDHGQSVSDAARSLRDAKGDSDSGHDFAQSTVHDTVVEMAHDNSHDAQSDMDDLSDTHNEISEHAQDMSNDASDAASSLSDDAADAAHEASESAQDSSQDAQDMSQDVMDTSGDLSNTVSDTVDTIVDQAHDMENDD